MTATRHSRLLQFTGLLFSALVWLANNGNPPTGRTGAPFDGSCGVGSGCHTGSNPGGFDGDVIMSGLPGTINPNTTYPITLTMNITAGSPTKGGFQLVVVDGNNVNAGDLSIANAQTGTEFFATREYIEHRNGKTFSGGTISWDFNWKSPVSGVNGNTLKFYFIGNFTNGNGNSGGDFPKSFLETFPFNGPPPVSAFISSSTNVLCFGGNTGSATVEAGGGAPPYTYLWSNGQNTATAINLIANTYTVTVTGSSGSGTASASVTITQPPVLNISASVADILTCAQTSVTAIASVSGGTPGYDVFWSDGQSGTSATFSSPGTYTATATDANGCTKVGSVTVNQNVTPPIATVAPGGTLDCMVTQTSLSGVGSSQGGNIAYNWTTVGGNIVSGGNTLAPVVNACGTYTLTVTNTTNGCTATASTTVTCQIDPPDIAASNTGPLTCTVLSVTLNGNSNTSGVTFAWTGPNGFSAVDQNTTTDTVGTYTLVVNNPANGCSSSATTVVSQNIAPPTDTVNVSGMITCATDSVYIFMNTNIQNATFLWTGPNGFMSTQKKDTIGVPGQYIGVVTNPANGCKTRDTIAVVQNIDPPGATAMANGSITCLTTNVPLTGGPSGANSYAWTGPNNYTSTQQNPIVDISGMYTLVVTADTTGCTSSATVMVQQNTTPPVATIAVPDNLNCNSTTVQLNATGSSQGPSFSYLWTTTNGIIVSGGTTLTPVVSAAGTYNLLVTNTNNGCTSTAGTSVFQSTPVLATITSSTNVACNGAANGAASAMGSGGNGTFTYLWSNGATTASITGLSAGTYNVTVKDGENCTATTMVSITQPSPLVANASATGETFLGANNGMAIAAPSGGTPGYSFSWSNGGTTATITNLAPGTYTVSVTDANGCTAVKSVTVNAFGCNLSGDISAVNATCNGANDGTAAVTLNGQTDPVSFEWSNGNTTQMVTGLAPGSYTVSVVDGNNCPVVFTTSISQPTALAANASATGETATGANNGTATASPTGGTGTYSFEWSNGALTAAITSLAPGAYTVSVTDANNCTAVQTVSVAAFNCAITAFVTSANAACFGQNDGQATAVLGGGQLPYSYLWSSGATTATANNLLAGTYTVTGTDAAGCSTTESITISEPTLLTAQATNIQNVVCPSANTGSASIVALGGTAPYMINGNLTNLGVGPHTATVVDANGCSTIVSFNIVATDNQAPVVSCPATIFICGANIVSWPGGVTVTDNCGSLPGQPVLISGQPNGSAFNDGTTVQVYRATDASGNSSTCSFAVVVYPVADILFNGSTNDQNGQGVGSISVTPVGGAGNFFFIWNKNGQFFSNNEDLTGLTAGSYTLTLTDGNGCTSALAPVIINNTVGTFNLGETGYIRLSPNPTSATFQLEIIGLEVVAATIIDIRGRVMYQMQALEWKGEVDVSQLSSGVYFLRLATNSGKLVTLKFVKTE